MYFAIIKTYPGDKSVTISLCQLFRYSSFFSNFLCYNVTSHGTAHDLYVHYACVLQLHSYIDMIPQHVILFVKSIVFFKLTFYFDI